MEHGRIAIRQFTLLIIMFIIGSSILLVPAALALDSKQDAWLSAIVGVAVGLALIALFNKLSARFPDKTFVEYSELLLGKWLGKLVSLSYFVFAFLLAVFMLRYIGDFMTTQVMTETPIQAIHLLFMVIVVMGAILGLETFARTAEIFFPWVIVFFVVLVVLVTPQFEPDYIQPVMENSVKTIIKGSFALIGIPYLELVLFLMIIPFVKLKEERGKAFIVGGIVGGTIIFAITLVSILVLGPDMTVRDIYPGFVLTKKINIGKFLQRLESMLAVVWFLTIYFKLTITYYVAALVLAQVLQLKHYRPLVTPLALFTLVFSLLVYPNIVYGINFAGKIWMPFAATFGLLLPLLLLIMSYIRKKKEA